MKKRQLGKTGLELSVIGIGGFHLVEIPRTDVSSLLNTYLDRGGNYIETAQGYGSGSSEKKIGVYCTKSNGSRPTRVISKTWLARSWG